MAGMTPTPLADLHVTDPPLASALAELHNLEVVLAWAPTLAGIDAVQMDEYHSDILVPLTSDRWAVFGVT